MLWWDGRGRGGGATTATSARWLGGGLRFERVFRDAEDRLDDLVGDNILPGAAVPDGSAVQQRGDGRIR